MTRDGRIAMVILLRAGNLEQDSAAETTINNGTSGKVTFMWLRVLLDSNRLIGDIISFCSDLDMSHGTLISQGLWTSLKTFKRGEERI